MQTESRTRVALALHGVFGRTYRVPDAWHEGLSPEDAALAQAILGLCLRQWGRLQNWVQPRLKNPGREIPTGSRVALAMGLAQLAWLPGVLTHAAVNESVLLASDANVGFPPHKGLVNALLRQASKDRAALRSELEALPAALNRSDFANRALRSALAPRQTDLGAELCIGSRIETLWHSLQQPPRPSFRALTSDPLPEGLEPDPLFPAALRLAPDAPFPRTWLASGQGMVQDLSSQAMMSFEWNERPLRILDTCAAPGGKTTALAQRWPEAELYAVEADGKRAKRLEENLAVRRVKAQVIAEEAGAWMHKGSNLFDLILVDAPCSGSGTLRKHPELNWLGEFLDLPRLARNQRALLEAAITRLAPGGLLIYAVCSWLPEEGLEHQKYMVERHPELKPAALWPAAYGTDEGSATLFRPDPLTWPGEGFQAFAFTRPRA